MWRELCFHNKVLNDGVRAALRSGTVRINPESGLIEPLYSSASYDQNWLFFGRTVAKRDCYLWHQIMFDCFGHLVPEFCRLRCYKVVVKVRNFHEAMLFYKAMLAAPLAAGSLVPIHGKVGLDERNYTDGIFNGFVYCDGLDDASERYRYVRELVDAQIDTTYAQKLGFPKQIPVIIKRTCTEFEREHGPTDGPYWQRMSPEDIDLQHRIEDIVHGVWSMTVQPDWIINKTVDRMMKWANTVNDKSWMEHFGCEDFLTMKAVTYHHLAETKGVRGPKSKANPKRKKK